MKYILRNSSVINGKKNLEHIYTYKNFPVFIGVTDQTMKADLFADLTISICRDTGIIQLDKVLPLELVYSGYHSEALGGVWQKHHQEFIAFIKKCNLKNVLEIGGSNGRLAIDFTDSDKRINWVIVEPNPVIVSHPQIKFIKKLFDSDFDYDRRIDGLIHSHTFEHMYNPRKFLKKVASLLKTGQLHIFSVPSLYVYLKNGFTNVLNFEHTIFLTEYFVDYLLYKYQFKIIEKKYFADHSIFYATQKSDIKTKFRLRSQYSKYKKMYINYIGNNDKFIKKLNKKIDSFPGELYLFGAHVFSQYLINQGLHTDKLRGILDNSKVKQGKRLYGSPFNIHSPKILEKRKNIAVILRAEVYQNEVKKQLKTINSGVKIWE